MMHRVVVVHGAFAPLMEDNVFIRQDVPGRPKPGPRNWADSYSYNNSCYCNTTFDHGLATVIVPTPLGNLTILQVCTLLNSTAPIGFKIGQRPLYNDIQCGNGPSVIDDEVDCPGRTEYGQEGCKYIGPKWDFTPFLKRATKSPGIATPATISPRQAPTISSPVVGVVSGSPVKAPIPAQVPSQIRGPSDGTMPTKAPIRPITPTNPLNTTPTITNTIPPSPVPILTSESSIRTGMFRWVMQQFLAVVRSLFS